MKIAEILDKCIDRINTIGWRADDHIDGDSPETSSGPLCMVWTIDAVTSKYDDFEQTRAYINRTLNREETASLAPWNDYSTKEVVLETLAKAKALAEEEGA